MSEQVVAERGTDGTAAHAQVAMLAGMLGGARPTFRQLLEAASIAGLVDLDTDALAELLGPAAGPEQAPREAKTVREFYEETVVPIARAASGEEKRGGGMFRTYNSYWKVMVFGYPYQREGVATRTGQIVGNDPVPAEERLYDGLGDRLVSQVRYKDLVELLDWCRIRAELATDRAAGRREQRGRSIRHSDQQGAVRNAVGAIRYFFAQAVADEQIPESKDISKRLSKPGKKPSSRRAFTPSEYAELWDTVVSGGDDPELDALLVETVLVTGARREGLINLNLNHLDQIRVSIWLDEKNGRIDEQPATAELLQRLQAFARSRGSTNGTDPVFCFKDSISRGRPHRISDRRFDTLHARIQRELPWADRLGVTLHWCRHHAITTVERIASEAVAARFARHTSGSVTRGYDKASGEEVCAAVSAMTGTQHPLAHGGW